MLCIKLVRGGMSVDSSSVEISVCGIRSKSAGVGSKRIACGMGLCRVLRYG